MPNPTAPARLNLLGVLGVCQRICVPVAVRVEGDVVTGQSTPFEAGAALSEARDALPLDGEPGALQARAENGSVVVSGPALTPGSEAFVAPPPGLDLGIARRDGDAFRAPIRSGEPEGTLTVVMRDGERETRHAVPIAAD